MKIASQATPESLAGHGLSTTALGKFLLLAIIAKVAKSICQTSIEKA